MNTLPVRVKAALAATAIVALATTMGSVGLVLSQQNMLTRSLDASALLRINDIEASLADRILPTEITIIGDDSGFVQILDSQGRIISATKNIAGEAALISAPRAAGSSSHHIVLENQVISAFDNVTFRVIAKQISAKKNVYIAIVGYSTEKMRSSISYLEKLLFGLNLLVILLVYLATWFVTGRALRPVEKMRLEVDGFSTEEFSKRVTVPKSADEIGRLGKTLNSMLDKLEVSDQQQRQFVSDASHELRNPLAGMRTQLEVELLYPDASKVQESRETLLAATLRLQELTEDLLALAAADGNRSQSYQGLVNLAELIRTEADRFALAPGIRLDTSNVGAGLVYGNESQLRRVFVNLLDNANRFAENLILVRLADRNGKIIWEVIDDGPGISVTDKGRIFERFSRLDNARSRNAGGTGLGLAIVKEIVLAHGGEIHLAPDDSGAHFVITLDKSSMRAQY